ncbi:hypothetical protein KWE47_03545 [Acinetobacter baumannii]
MLDPSIITRGAERAQLQQQQTNEMLGNLGGALGQMVLGRRINQMRQLGTPDEQKAFANNSIFAPQLNQVLKSDQVTAQKNAIDLLKAQAEIGKTNSEATKNNAQAGGFTLDNSQKKFGAIQGVMQQAAMTGDKGQVLLGLDALQRSGVISPDDYAHNFSIIQAMTRDEVKNYAKGIVFTNKDTAPYLFQTKNNAADNATSVANNVRTTNATLTGQRIAAETAEKNRIQQDKQFQKNFEYRAQQDELKNGQGELKELGGKVYLVYKNGTYRPAIGEDGQQITSQQKGGGMTEQQSKDALFGARMQQSNSIINQLEKSDVSRTLLSRAPIVGEGLSNVLPSFLGGANPQQQQYMQAQRDFINAVLRKESGAVIADSEFENAQKQYFPQIGDSPAVIQQKAKNRQLAVDMIINGSGKVGQENIQKATQQQGQNPSNQAKLNNILFGK